MQLQCLVLIRIYHLDIDSTILHLEKIIKDGCHGVAIFGSTGAGQLISKMKKKN